MTSMPRRETLRYVKPKENDVDRAHRLLTEIVCEHGESDPRFTRALVVRLHTMRLTPTVLLTAEGYDAVAAVVLALDNWRELTPSPGRVLSKAWLKALEVVGSRRGFSTRLSESGDVQRTNRSYFTNNIRIR